jgi:hypothetical protein
MLRSVFLLRLTNEEEDGLENIDVRLKCHNMVLNGATCNDETSYNNEMRIGEDKERNGKWNNTKEIKTSKKKDMKNKEMENKPTPYCQSKIILSLSVRAEKMMEKNSGRFSRPLTFLDSIFYKVFFNLLTSPCLVSLCK